MSRRALLWLVPLFITLHNLEEMIFMPRLLADLPGKIPAWAANLLPAGIFPPTYRQFLWMLLVVTLLPYGLALLGGAKRERGLRTLLLSGAQVAILLNVLSHIATMNLVNGYAPGLVTALAFNLPFSLFFIGTGLRQGWLKWSDFGYMVPIALLLIGPGLFGLMALIPPTLH